MEHKNGGKTSMVVLLSILGMFCWGIAPIFAKLGLNNLHPVMGLAIRTVFAAVFVLGWVFIGGFYTPVKTIPPNTWVFLVMEALLATIVGDLAYFMAIKNGDVSLVTVIMASSPLVTIICTIIFLGEQVTWLRLAGAACIVLGISLIL